MVEEQVRFKVGVESELPIVLGQLDKLIQAQIDLGNQGDKMSKKIQDSYRTQSLAIRDLTSTVQNNFKEINANAESHADKVKGLGRDYDSFGNNIKSVRNQLIAAFGISELKTHIEKIFELTATYQKYQAALSVGLGNEKKAAEALEMLQQYADKTNFTLDELAETFTKFANRGLVLTQQEMGKLGDVANALQKPFAQLGEAILDVNNTERWNELGIKAKTAGDKVQLTFKGVTLEVERTEKGVLGAIVAFGDLNGVAGQTEAQARTLAGQYSTLQDSAAGLGRTVGNAMTPAFMAAIEASGGFIKIIAGSESAFTRTVTWVKATAAALLTYQSATRGAAAVAAAWELVLKGKTLVMGTYNLAMITATGTTEGLTYAQLRGAAAARSTWAALAANPLGPIVAAIGLATAAYYAFKAAQTEVNISVDAATEKLIREKAELTAAVSAVQGYSIGTRERTKAVQELINKYPGMLSYMDAETVSNRQLNKALTEQIKLLDAKIKYAAAAAVADDVAKESLEINKQQFEIINKLRGRYKELSESYPDNTKFLAQLRAQETSLRNVQYSSVAAAAATQGTIKPMGDVSGMLDKYNSLQKESVKIQGQWTLAIVEKSKASSQSVNAEIDEVNRQLKVLDLAHKQKKVNDEDYKVSRQKLLDEIKRLNGEEVNNNDDKIKKIGNSAKDGAKKTAAEIQKINLQGMEQTFDVRQKLIEVNAQIEIDKLNALIKKKKISEEDFTAQVVEINKKKVADLKKLDDERQAQEKFSAAEIQRANLEAMEKTYEVRRKIIENAADIEIASINKMLAKEKISREQAAAQIKVVEEKKTADLLAIKNEEDSKIEALTKKLQDSVADINLKAGKEVIKINAETVKKIIDGKMELGDYEKVIAAEREKIEKDLAEKVRKINEDTAKIIKATREGELKFAQETLEKFIGQHSELGGAALKVWNDYSNTVANSKDALEAVYVAQDKLNALQSSGTASVTELAEANKDLADAQQKQSKAGMDAVQMNLNLASTIAQVAEAIKDSLVNEALKAYELIGQAIGRTREVVVEYYNGIIESNRQAMGEELENFTGTWDEKERIMTAYFAREQEMMGARDRADAEMSFQQNVLAITADTTSKISEAWDISKGPLGPKALFNVLMSFREHNAQLNAAAYEREAYEEQLRQQRIQQEVDAARQVRDAKLAALQEEMNAFEAAKNKEIELAKATSDDKNLRLQADDVYRRQLLADGEAREVAALEAAKQRELDRAAQAGASAEERARITAAFDKLIADTHIAYAQSMGDKDKEINLAQRELEAATAAEIKALKDEIANKDAQVNDAMTFENEKYRNFVINSNRAMLESQKAMAIAQLRAEIAILKGKRNIFNSGRINSAIGDIEGAIRELEGVGAGEVALGDAFANTIKGVFISQNKTNKTPFNSETMQPVTEAFDRSGNPITLTYTDEDREFVAFDKSGNAFKLRNAYGVAEKTGERFFRGSEWVDGMGYPDGIDTVPAWLTKGERVLPTALNEQLGPMVTNEELVKSYLKMDELKARFGDIRIPEFGMLNFGTGTTSLKSNVDFSGLEKEVRELTEVIRGKPEISIHVDANQISVAEMGRHQQHVTYYENQYNR